MGSVRFPQDREHRGRGRGRGSGPRPGVSRAAAGLRVAAGLLTSVAPPVLRRWRQSPRIHGGMRVPPLTAGSTGAQGVRGIVGFFLSYFDCVPPKGSAPELSHRGPSALIPEVKGSQRSTPGERTRTPRLCFQTRGRRSAQGGRDHPRCKHCPSRRGAQRRGARRHRGKAKPALDVTGNDRDAVSAAPPPGLGFLVCETGALEGTGSGLSRPGGPAASERTSGPSPRHNGRERQCPVSPRDLSAPFVEAEVTRHPQILRAGAVRPPSRRVPGRWRVSPVTLGGTQGRV